MTVIAWDLKTLVADGRSTMGFQIVSDETIKIKEFKHKTLGNVKGAFCGLVMGVDPWVDHMVAEGFDKFELTEEMSEFGGCSAILVTEAGIAYEVDMNGLYHRVNRPIAYGSGNDIAQHYLTTGNDSLTAVREAIKTNASCGGRILAYSAETKKYRSYVR